MTIGSLFALLGVLERPTWGRVVLSFVLILFANLDRITTGLACVGAAILIGVWFGIGRDGRDNRRWCIPLLAVGLVPLLVGCAINYAKFGVPFGVSNLDQVWTSVNAYRRRFLAANHNSEYGTIFIPTTLLAYLKPDGLGLTSVFPFITLPSGPPEALAGVLFDRRYRTASLPASMPFLFFLSCWGVITAFRPRPIGGAARTRVLLLVSGIAGTALFVWGYIAPRYLADFLPFLVLASGVAMVDIWRRLEPKKLSVRFAWLAGICLVALFTIVANIGIAVIPNEEWDADPGGQLRAGPEVRERPDRRRAARSGWGRRCPRGDRPTSSSSWATATVCTSPTGRTTPPFPASSSCGRRGWWSSTAMPSSTPFSVTVPPGGAGQDQIGGTGRIGVRRRLVECHAHV